jgi:hypothetical protein
VTPVFFGSMRDSLQFLKVEGTRLVPTLDRVRDSFKMTANGLEEIDTADYDAFVLVGLSISMKRIHRFYGAYRFHGQTMPEKTLAIRRELAVEALASQYARMRLVALSKTLRELTDRPIYAFAEPFWGEAVMSTRPGKGWRVVETAGDSESLYQLFIDSVTRAASPHVTFIPQPQATIAHGIMSADIYNQRDASRSKEAAPDDEPDFAHMNAEFGRVCWDALLQTMGLAATGRADPIVNAKRA